MNVLPKYILLKKINQFLKLIKLFMNIYLKKHLFKIRRSKSLIFLLNLIFLIHIYKKSFILLSLYKITLMATIFFKKFSVKYKQHFKVNFPKCSEQNMCSQRVSDFMSREFREQKIIKNRHAKVVAYPQNDVRELALIMKDIRIDYVPVVSSPWNKKQIGVLELNKIKVFLND